MHVNDILAHQYVRDLIQKICGPKIELVTRAHCYVVRAKREGARDIHRIILLPPFGFTANAPDQMNSHDEAAFASIQVKGAVRPGKAGFSKLKACLRVAAKSDVGTISLLDQPYLTYDPHVTAGDQDGLSLKTYDAGTPPFAVVKEDGYGFYHNLENRTGDWLVLKLHKILRPSRGLALGPFLAALPNHSAAILKTLHGAIVAQGDGVYHTAPDLVAAVTALPVSHALPPLIEMLHIHDSGMHEACTVFSIILKLGKRHPQIVASHLRQADAANAVPPYYADQLLKKLGQHPQSPVPDNTATLYRLGMA